MIRVRISVVATALGATLLLVACQATTPSDLGQTPPAVAAQTFDVFLDARADIEDISIASYFPTAITVHPGDTVAFYNQSYTDEHTVTFGAGDGTIALAVDGAFDPRVGGACALASADASADGCVDSGSWADLPPYDGDGYWNSGLVSDQGAVEVHVAASMPPGTYAFRCLVHPAMTGTLRVAAPDTEIETAEVVHETALDEARAAAEGATFPSPSVPVRVGSVLAGWIDGIVSVNAFAPKELVVRAGDEVTWHVSETHDVTFDSLAAPERGSGPLGDGETYTVRFPEPGRYTYHDSMHVGMTGVVVVR
jgi:plastocyanin